MHKLYFCTIFWLCFDHCNLWWSSGLYKIDKSFLQSPGKSNNLPVAFIKKLLLLNWKLELMEHKILYNHISHFLQ